MFFCIHFDLFLKHYEIIPLLLNRWELVKSENKSNFGRWNIELLKAVSQKGV